VPEPVPAPEPEPAEPEEPGAEPEEPAAEPDEPVEPGKAKPKKPKKVGMGGKYTGALAGRPGGAISFIIEKGRMKGAQLSVGATRYKIRQQTLSGARVSFRGVAGPDHISADGVYDGRTDSFRGSWEATVKGRLTKGTWRVAAK
jgi:hypothetical protein